MSILIRADKCKACGRCCDVCPGNLIRPGRDQKAQIAYPQDCWGCASCVKECPFGAIALYLGADMGGMGSRMHVHSEPDVLVWSVERPDGTREQIRINQKESNKY